ncbi:apolipoprotein N-acyltransferase [Lewinella aquimaris]|uniref:Apolipoprotein N-acyltransferase n=1 Tax=Neolewinella aquimaris TaxID=1835722 RepID=A0A840E8X0_9BACT|nr:apolipoprotein N-acyltransferase [Neolewinella aquimaris]MBB4080162.1 apolipoprotein N-acyltransferase [Neolewinella aquimaris]
MSTRTRNYSGIILLLIAAIIAYVMYDRTGREELWGYLPLALYLSAWLGITLLLTSKGSPEKRRRFYLSSATGVLLGLGFPGYLPLPFLLLVAWVPLLLLQREGLPAKSVFWHGLNAFLLYNILATFWVTNTAFAAGLFAVVVNSLLMCIPWMLFHWTSRVSPRVAYLSLIAFWVSFEHLHYKWSLNWPWLTLGNGFAEYPSLIQWYEVTGVLGGSAWILAVNWLVLRFYLPRRPSFSWGLAAVVVLPMAGSLVRYLTYTPPPGETISVSAIQPNFEPHYEKFAGSQAEQLATFTALSREALASVSGPVDYLLLPETSFSNVEESVANTAPALRALMEALPEDKVRYFVTGISSYYRFKPGEAVTDAVRYYPGSDGGQVALEALNGAVQIDPETREFQTYRKGVFVPGAESFPFRKTLFFLEPLVNSLGGTVAGLGSQSERTVLEGERARVAPVICYESVFGEYFTDYIHAGAQAVFVMTNDGWWDNTAGHRQHLYFSSLRAVETRRAVVRSANMGACAFIDQRGHIVSRTFYDERGFLNGTLQLNDAVTPYVRFGDIPSRIALLLTAMALLSNIARTLRNRGTALEEG